MVFQEALSAPYLNLVPLVVLLPVAGLLINLLIGSRLGEKGISAIASLSVVGSFVVAALLAVSLAGSPEPKTVPFLDWITIGTLNVAWAFRVDTLSVTMMLVVSGVGALIHIYAAGYMHQDVRHNGDPARYRRFFVFLNLFIAAMMILVSADNFLMLFVGWEGVGLCSYLLIGFWFEKGEGGIGNALAAKKAFVVNRIGDFGLLIAMFLIFWNFGSLQFDAVFEKVPEVSQGVILAITLFLLLGVTGKSAQIPLYVWLPDAMAGPTPVSALIHAATMVTAGVYLVARSNPLYAANGTAGSAVAWVGAATALFAATIAVGQYDIKRVLAYSTISQLGFMVAAVGMGAYVAGMFHLITHAFFKALLFLSAGSVILGMEHGQEAAYHSHGSNSHGKVNSDDSHADFDPQDMRNMGGLRAKMPVTFWVYLTGALALAGIAPLSGFFSKDEILAAATDYNLGIFVLLILAAFLTAFYMGRQLLLVFFGATRTRAAGAARENRPIITVPLILLALLSFFGGLLNLPGVHTLETWLEHTIEIAHAAEFMPLVAGLALLISLIGVYIAWLVYGRRAPAARSGRVTGSLAPFIDPLQVRQPALFSALANAWGVNSAYYQTIVKGYQSLAAFMSAAFDEGLIDGIVNGFGYLTRWAAQFFSRFQTGFVRSYALMVVFGAAVILTYLAVSALW